MSDLISRQAAIDAIEPTLKSILQGNSVKAINVIDKIRDLPSAQPEPSQVARDIATIIENEQDMMVIERNAQQWIPCSERLPDMHDEVLVTARGEVSIAWLYVDGKWRSNDMPQPMLRDIIAWMPLPEPWRGEER